MAPAMSVLKSNDGDDFPGRFTKQVFVCSVIAAVGGLMFGYDIGISGGVTSMDDFLFKFFPQVYAKKQVEVEDNYCKFNNWNLQLFTSSLYLAAMVASFIASSLCKAYGRKVTITAASVFFMLGAVLNTIASNIYYLIFGRIFLGFGVGFGNTAVPLFISEIAPNKYRGGLNICFQLLITIGILCANFINLGTSQPKFHPNGWRFSLGGAVVPALILFIGSFFIVETPASLVERGKKDKALQTLKKIRGVEEVDTELEAIVNATVKAKASENGFKALMRRCNRPQLTVSVLLQIFQQFTGINVIMFYAPVLFQTIGLGNNAALLSTAVTGSVNVLSTLVANFCVDKFGRKPLLVGGAVVMLGSLVSVGCILLTQLGNSNSLSPQSASITLILICLFVAGFASSWGPLGWLIPSEIFPVETREAGFVSAVFINMLFTFGIAQLFLTALCKMKAYIFVFFGVWVAAMLVSALFFLPETKGIPIDEMTDRVWKKHWFWKMCYDDDTISIDKPDSQLGMA